MSKHTHEITLKLSNLIESSKKPIAIFDLDGTVFNVSYRHLAIIEEFIHLHRTNGDFKEFFPLLSKLGPDNFLYSVETTLNSIGITNYSEKSAEFIQKIEAYWFKHFFTDAYVVKDRPYKGALECVKFFEQKDCQIVYLSGRDIPNMSKGTIEALEKNGFPVHSKNVTILLKPAYGLDDLLFKKQAMETVQSEGTVVASFDNEPANVQMFLDLFPDGMHFHYYSQFARNLPLKGKNLYVIKQFSEIGF